MKLYPHATPDGIIQLVELAEFEKAKLAAIGLEAEVAGLRAELTSWQSVAERLATAISAIHQPFGDETPTSGNPCVGPNPPQGRAIAAALAAYESAKKRVPHMFTPCESCEGPLVCSDLGNCYASKSGNLPDPLAEAVKRMEAVTNEELDMEWRQSPEGFEKGHEAIRARLISAAKGEQP